MNWESAIIYSTASIPVAAFKHLSELLPEEDKSLMNDNLSWLPLVAAVLTASCSVCFFMNMNYVKKNMSFTKTDRWPISNYHGALWGVVSN